MIAKRPTATRRTVHTAPGVLVIRWQFGRAAPWWNVDYTAPCRPNYQFDRLRDALAHVAKGQSQSAE